MPKGTWGGSRFAWPLLVILLIDATILIGEAGVAETINGFVTKIGSSTEFYVGESDIQTDGRTRCATESLDTNIYLPHGGLYPASTSRLFKLQTKPDLTSRRSVSCRNIPWSVGAHVEVMGLSSGSDQPLRATQITAFTVEIHQQFAQAATNGELEGATLLEEQLQIRRAEGGWTGTGWLDGYPLTIMPNTDVQTAPAGTEVSFRLFSSFGIPHWSAVKPKTTQLPFTPALFEPNSWAVYEASDLFNEKPVGGNPRGGERVLPGNSESIPVEGQVRLERVRLWPSQPNAREQEYITQFTPVVHLPDYTHRIPGTIAFDYKNANKGLRIIPDQAVQEFVFKLGSSLVPGYQRRLAGNDPTKINFRFYAVQGVKPRSNDEMSRADSMVLAWHKDLDRGVVALPDGMILVPDYMMARIGNEAQVATLLSCAIASVVQKQGFVTRRSRPWDNAADSNPDSIGYPIHGFIFYLLRDEQELRLGIRQMYLAGYDIRESPLAWAAAAGHPVSNPFVGSADKHPEIPWYAAYAFDYISRYYSDVDYGKLKRGEKEYAVFLDELRKADPEAFAEKK